MRLLLHKTNLFTTALAVTPHSGGSTQDQYLPTVSPISVSLLTKFPFFRHNYPTLISLSLLSFMSENSLSSDSKSLSFRCYLTSLKYHWLLTPSCYLRPCWHAKIMLVWKVQYWTRLINLPTSILRPSDSSTNHVLYAGTLQNSCICGWV